MPDAVNASLGAPGAPLEAGTRIFMQTRLGHDFGAVRVHTDERAAESALATDALAYTVGNHIVFGAGQYAPHTQHGQRLLAHELVHVMQQAQTNGPVAPAATSLRLGEPRHAYEQQADRVADRALGGAAPKQTPAAHGQRAGVVQRAVCPPTPTGIGDTPPSPDCETPTHTPIGDKYLFCTDSDHLQTASETNLIHDAVLLATLPSVEIHGYASPEGPTGREADYNLNLSCKRALRAKDVLVSHGVSAAKVRTFKHGGTSEWGAPSANRSVIIPKVSAPPSTVPRKTISFRVAAVSYLACVPCNPFTDDAGKALTPPTAEPPTDQKYRMKHWIEAEIRTADSVHIDSNGVKGGHSAGESGYCGTIYPAPLLKGTKGPLGPSRVTSPVHGEGMGWESEIVSQVGAIVPCTLPGAPCGPLGTNPGIPPIGNRFRIRLFADGTKESEFVSASGMPFHYLYEDGHIKMFGGAPVHPAQDLRTWAESTGVSLEDAEVGFKALREACCHNGHLPGCVCECGDDHKTREMRGFGIDSQSLYFACMGAGAGLKFSSCPTPCAPSGTDCALPNWPANPP